MPKIAELREIEGAMWARLEMDLGGGAVLLSEPEIDAQRKREMRQLDEIERLRAALALLKIAVDREGWPAGWNLIRKDVDAALGTQQQAREK